jgi:hypothetical protein
MLDRRYAYEHGIEYPDYDEEMRLLDEYKAYREWKEVHDFETARLERDAEVEMKAYKIAYDRTAACQKIDRIVEKERYEYLSKYTRERIQIAPNQHLFDPTYSKDTTFAYPDIPAWDRVPHKVTWDLLHNEGRKCYQEVREEELGQWDLKSRNRNERIQKRLEHGWKLYPGDVLQGVVWWYRKTLGVEDNLPLGIEKHDTDSRYADCPMTISMTLTTVVSLAVIILSMINGEPYMAEGSRSVIVGILAYGGFVFCPLAFITWIVYVGAAQPLFALLKGLLSPVLQTNYGKGVMESNEFLNITHFNQYRGEIMRDVHAQSGQLDDKYPNVNSRVIRGFYDRDPERVYSYDEEPENERPAGCVIPDDPDAILWDYRRWHRENDEKLKLKNRKG